MFIRQKFAHRILLMPAVAVLGFGSIIVMTMRVAWTNEQIMNRIERGYAEAVDLARDVEELLVRIQSGYQDAVAAQEESFLDDTAALVDETTARLDDGKRIGTLSPEELDRLASSFREYSAFADDTSRRWIAGETGAGLARAQEEMRVRYVGLRNEVQSFRAMQRTRMEDAFSLARERHADSIKAMIGITLVALLLLGSLSWLILRRMNRDLGQAVEIADQLARGEVREPVAVGSDDEIGHLIVKMNDMVERVQDRTNELQHEVSERRRAEMALRTSEERYAIAAKGANDALWDWDLRAGTVHYSDRWYSMLELDPSEVESTIENWFERVHPDDVDSLRSRLGAHLAGGSDQFEHEHRVRQHDGTYIWILTRGAAVRDVSGRANRIAGSMTDVTQRRRFEDQLVHDAFHDSLTGLPNRALFLDRLDRALKRGRRSHSRCAVLFIDLDRFKLVNDSFGHEKGDELLIAFAGRLVPLLRSTDTAARLGGDEFVILLDSVEDVANANQVTERIREQLQSPFNLGGQDVFLTASIGVAVGSSDYTRAEDLLRDADIAMYRAKEHGRARTEIFGAAMHEQVLAALQMQNDLRRALTREEFRILFQPVIDIRTREIRTLEALVRWQHPVRGLILPDHFISTAEETGLIVPLGRWILVEACRHMQAWRERFSSARRIGVSVNLSAKQLSEDDLIDQIDTVLSETRLPADSLRFEITESIIMDQGEGAVELLNRLKQRGVALYMDDFGTGYSSLSYLHRFPLDTLKIDRSFVSGKWGTGEDNWEIVRTIVQLARSLRMDVIAEGVETELQLDRVRAANCHLAQGYYFARPLAPEDIHDLLDKMHGRVIGSSWQQQVG